MNRFIILLFLFLGICSCSIKEEFPADNSLNLEYRTIGQDTIKKYAGYIYKDLFNKCLNEMYSSSNDSISLKTFAYQAYLIGNAYSHTEYFDYPKITISRTSFIDLNDSIRSQINMPIHKRFYSLKLEERKPKEICDYFDELRNFIFRDVVFNQPNQVLRPHRSGDFFRYGISKGFSDAENDDFVSYAQFDLDYLEKTMSLLFENEQIPKKLESNDEI